MTVTATPLVTASGAAATARRALWFFLGSFVSYLAIIVVSIVLSNPDYQTALYDKADELGLNQNHLPPEVMAELSRTYPDPITSLVATAVLFVLSGVLLALGVRLLGLLAFRPALAKVAAVLAVLGGIAMAVMTFLPRLLADGSEWLAGNWWIYMGLVAAAVIASSLALILVAVAVRNAGLARRTAIVVVVLCVLTIVAQVATAGAPPIVPMLLGAVLAFNVRRGSRMAD